VLEDVAADDAVERFSGRAEVPEDVACDDLVDA
jgi:hypothetical protein